MIATYLNQILVYLGGILASLNVALVVSPKRGYSSCLTDQNGKYVVITLRQISEKSGTMYAFW